MSKTKTISFADSLHEQIKAYSELDNITFNKAVNELVKIGLEQVAHPLPKDEVVAKKEEALKVCRALWTLINKLPYKVVEIKEVPVKVENDDIDDIDDIDDSEVDDDLL